MTKITNKKNPYSPPKAVVSDTYQPHGEEMFVEEGQALSFTKGFEWFRDGLKIFMAAPGTWLVITFICVAIELFFNEVGILLNISYLYMFPIINLILCTLLLAGIVRVAEFQRITGKAKLQLLKEGFTRRTSGLVGSYVILLAMFTTGFVLAILYLGSQLLVYIKPLTYAISYEDHNGVTDILQQINLVQFLVAPVIIFAGLVVGTLLTYVVPPLIMIHNLTLTQALLVSFKGCIKNLLPGIAYFGSLAIVSAFIVFVLPSTQFDNVKPVYWLLLSFFKVPFWLLPVYAAYRSIFIKATTLKTSS